MWTDSSGKRANQKLKPYIVLQILQRETDENHVLSSVKIAAALSKGTVLVDINSSVSKNRPHRKPPKTKRFRGELHSSAKTLAPTGDKQNRSPAQRVRFWEEERRSE